MYQVDKNKLDIIIKHFGKYPQIIKLAEEFGELNKAILNRENGFTMTNGEITSELADVYILLEQIKMMYEVDENEVQNVIDMKVDRVFDKYNINIF